MRAATRDGQSFVLEDMVFSMMAHISHDLPLALLEVELEGDGGSNIADYHLMNEVLGSQIDAIQRATARRYQRSLAWLDRLAGHYDEFFTNYGIRLSRSSAWYNACRLLDPASHDAAQQSILRSTGAFIDFVRVPKAWWLRLLVRGVRALAPKRRRWPSPSQSPES